MIAKLQPNRVRRTYLGGGRIDAFTGGSRSCATETDGGGSQFTATADAQERVPPVVADAINCVPPMPMPEDWMASTTTAFNGTLEIEGEGLGRLEDGRLVKDVVGTLPILVKLLDSDERLVIQAHPTVPCAKRLFNSPVGKTECWYFLPGTAPDACVYLGFKPGITREKWEEAFWGGSRSCATAAETAAPHADAQERVPPLKPEIAFADFEKLDLRVGKVLSCEIVPKSSKLLKFELDAGGLGKRTIFSGIRGAYPDPSALVGKEVVFVANLAPRKMSVGVSEGMILFAGEPGVAGGVLAPFADAGAGTPCT